MAVREPTWIRGCTGLLGIVFIIWWIPTVFVMSGRHAYHYAMEPQCSVTLPPDLMGLPVGFTDFKGVTRKPIPFLTIDECLSRSPRAPIVQAEWRGPSEGCALQLQDASGREFWHTLPLIAYAGVTAAAGEHLCSLFAHPRTTAHWENQDFCELTNHNVTAALDDFQCFSSAGEWHGNNSPIAPPFLRFNIIGKLIAWSHTISGSLWFLLGMVQFQFPGSMGKYHKPIGYVSSSSLMLVWITTWGTFFPRQDLIFFAFTALFQFYILYGLVTSVLAARRKRFGEHRRWMLRVFAATMTIVIGRYVGRMCASLAPLFPLGSFRTAANFTTINVMCCMFCIIFGMEWYLKTHEQYPVATAAPASDKMEEADVKPGEVEMDDRRLLNRV